ncbi:MAG: hypothetical protein GX621_09065 [Pirellulaceae bacterium]|nr:hypothetical protein [Pirellulaceae bacterium]
MALEGSRPFSPTTGKRGARGFGFVVVQLAVLLACVSGCGDGRPSRVPVSGQVLIDGKPLTLGTITFVPADARSAVAQIGPDGRFTLATFEPGDGVMLGTFDVSVLAVESLTPKSLRWHAPKNYADPNTSGLKETIDGPTDSLVIKLTWDGGKPFVERVEGGGE